MHWRIIEPIFEQGHNVRKVDRTNFFRGLAQLRYDATPNQGKIDVAGASPDTGARKPLIFMNSS